ncbi:hypothetical protein [Halorhabdus rudnickae]|uniref:hypothetical protein n=1 Tax=Halorhabdus rudnickae TaxID=1775544 RepID=UPI0010837F82|nr:hypothetical protein [Halorhabdus rudnickae]
MEVRDAVEADTERLAELTASPVDVMRNLVHDRTVRVALDPDDESIVGFVSFDARREVVHVTQFEGTTAACTRLLEEPIGFARRETMAVEVLLPDSRTDIRGVLEQEGFEEDGTGPRFDGEPTVRYRLDPAEIA